MPRIAKSPRSAEDYLPWAGRFCTEADNPKVYANHPEYWKKQRSYMNECRTLGVEVDPEKMEEIVRENS